MLRDVVKAIEGRRSSQNELVVKRPLSSLLALTGTLSARFDDFLLSRTNQLLIDGIVVAAALWAAYMIRFDGEIPADYLRQFELVAPFAMVLYVGLSYVSGLYHLVWRFIGAHDALKIAYRVAMAGTVCILYRLVDPSALPVPYGVLVLHPLLAYSGLLGVRLTRRALYHRRGEGRTSNHVAPHAGRKRLLLIGAGEAGLRLLHELSETQFEVVGFLDDDVRLQGRTIGGWRIVGTTDQLEAAITQHAVDEVVFCIPSAPKVALKKLAARCANLPVKVSSVPTLWEIMSGQVAIGALRSLTSVKMEDLLGRDSISYPKDLEELSRTYRGQPILVTGAGGSIGSELVRQLKQFRPSQLILLDKDENNLYETACEIKEEFADITEVVANVRHLDQIRKVFERHRPAVVFHAAAYKHVPLMEHYPAEAILNNVIGTRNLAEVSHECGVKTFVMISTDKAVNPTSMMGASKRVAEMIVQKFASLGSTTRFCCVRFGNVLGSRASVVPIFQRQIRQGKNITVTHPDVSRYFMTIPEAVQLVIQAGTLGDRGEVFLLDMGDPVRIVDLARNLIELSGLVPDKDVKIEFTGLRPGEKLDEELLTSGEHGFRNTKYSKIFVVEALQRDWKTFEGLLEELEGAARVGDATDIRNVLSTLNIGYQGYKGRAAAKARASGDWTQDGQERLEDFVTSTV